MTSCDVPQESVLGQMLYSIYYAYSPRIQLFCWNIYCYTDDVQCYKSYTLKTMNRLIDRD